MFLLKIIISILLINYSYEQLQNNQNINNIVFDLADLAFDYETEYDDVHIEAFKTLENNIIIDNKTESKYSQLRWVSIGNPQLKIIKSNNDNSKSEIFLLKPEGFDMFVIMLTQECREIFKSEVKLKYNITVRTSQILSLVPSKFECQILFLSNGEKILLKGQGVQMNKNPIRVSFNANEGSKERKLFEERLLKSGRDLNLDIVCEVTSQGKATRQNTLLINTQQMNFMNIIDDIFGDGQEKYVTRNQVSQLSAEIYQNLNIIEDYQIPLSDFKEKFVDDFIQQTANTVFLNVDFDKAISQLSSYNFKEDLKPDIIKSEMSKIFTIDKTSSKESLKYDQKEIEKLSSKYDKFKLDASWFSIKGSYEGKQINSEKDQSTVLDKLNEINLHNENNIEWERKGDIIIPKTIKVAKLSRASFNKNLLFSRIKRTYEDAPFKRKYTFNTFFNNKFMETHESMPTNNYNEIKKLNDTVSLIMNNIKMNSNNYQTLIGHNDSVSIILVLSNGNLVSGCRDSTIKLWDKNTLECLKTLNEHSDNILSLVVLPNGNFASGSRDTTIKIWNENSFVCLKTLSGHNGTVLSLTVLQNENLVSGSKDGTIKIWERNSYKCIKTLNQHNGSVWSVIVLSNGDLASGSEDKTIKIWKKNTFECVKTLSEHNGTVFSLAVLLNGNLASGSEDKTIKIWDKNNYECIKTLNGHTNTAITLTVLSNGNLASGSNDKTIKIWDKDTLKCIKTLNGHSGSIWSLAVLSNGYLASGSFDSTIKIWYSYY